MAKPLSLQEFAKEFGSVIELAEAIGAHRTTVYTWLKREKTPTLAQAVALIDLSRGRLTAKAIFLSTENNGRSDRRRREVLHA